jgi:hypothetical protein
VVFEALNGARFVQLQNLKNHVGPKGGGLYIGHLISCKLVEFFKEFHHFVFSSNVPNFLFVNGSMPFLCDFGEIVPTDRYYTTSHIPWKTGIFLSLPWFIRVVCPN